MFQPGGGAGIGREPLLFWPWAADNGCFAQGESFVPGDWLEWLASLRRYRGRCLFAAAPDIVGDAEATRARALPYLPTIRQLGFPAAYVGQNGATPEMLPWDTFDVLFIGGSTDWKLSEAAYRLAAEAARRGKWTHLGRVNSLRRLRSARVSGYDSADGTFVRFGPDRRLPEVYDWLDTVNGQLALDMPA